MGGPRSGRKEKCAPCRYALTPFAAPAGKARAAPMPAEPVGDAERLRARGVPPACPPRRFAVAPWRPGATVRLVVAGLLVCGAAARDAAGQQPRVTLEVSPATLMEDSGGADVRVTATLSASRSASTAVTLSLGGEARPGGPGVGDYTVSPASPVISIPAGSIDGSVTLVVNPVDDTYWEQAEEITVDGSANGVTVTGDSFVIEDDEQAPGLEVGFNNRTIRHLVPGQQFVDTVALRLTGDSTFESAETVTVDVSGPSDYYTASPAFPFTLTLPAGATTVQSAAVTVVVASDITASRSFRLNASFDDHPSVAVNSFNGFEIRPELLRYTISYFAFEPGAIAAGAGSVSVTATMRISPAPTEDLTAVVRSTNTAVPAFEFEFSAGTTEATATATIVAPSSADRLYFPPPSATDEYSFTGTIPLLPIYDATLSVGDIYSTSSLGQGSDFMLTGDYFVVAIYFNQSFSTVSSPTLAITLDSGPGITAPCSFVRAGSNALQCRYYVRAGDSDEDKVMQLDTGALDFGGQTLRSPYDANIVFATPVVPSGPISITIPRRVVGGTDEIRLLASLESLQEGVGPAQVVVTATRTGTNFNQTAPRNILIPLAFVDGTTTAGDYSVSGTRTITIPQGQASGTTTLTVTAVDDFVKENRTEVVRIEAETVPEVVYGTALNIIDAPNIVLSVLPGSVAEDGGVQTVTVTASLGDPTDSVRPRPIPVTLTWGGGTAGAGDFSVSGTTVTIPASARSGTATVTITPVDDNLLEGDETIGLRGATPGLVVQGTTLTLADDEEVPAVSLAVSRDRIVESDSAVTVTVSATLDPDVAMANDVTTVELELMGSATRDTDYTRTWSPSTPVISIPLNATMGSNTVTLTLTPQQDEVAEGDETIVVEGTATTGTRSLVVKVANITLQDDDVRGVVVTPTRLEIDEGSSEQYTVRLTAEPLSDVTVSVGVPGGAPLAADPVVLTFTPTTWSAAQTVTVTVEDDADAVMHADVELTHTVGGGGYDGVTASSVAVTLAETTVPQMEIAAGSAEESAGLMTFAVTLDVASSEEVSASWATAGVTAAAGADYTESSGTVVFSAGIQSRTIIVPILPDDLDEEDETFTVTLSGVQNAALSVSEATGTITDDDDEPALSVSGPGSAAVEGTDTSLVFTVTLAPGSGREVTVGYATSDGTAEAPGDYTAAVADATLTFAPGETSKTVTVPIVDDDLDEPEETFRLVLQQPQGATLSVAEATGTIADNDAEPALSVAEATAAEDAGPVTFTVTLAPGSGHAVTVGYATSDGTAEAPGDYTAAAAGATLTFAPGETTKTIEVAVIDDDLDEADEAFTLTLSGAVRAGFAGGGSTAEATGTITDDDATPVVRVEDVTVAESAGTLVFEVTLDGPSGHVVTMNYWTSDRSATSPADYATTSGGLAFAPGQTVQSIVVPIVDDADDEEESEDFTLTLSLPINAVFPEDAETLAATGTITDDDDPAVEVSFGSASYEAAEGGSAVTVTVSVSVDPEREVTVPLTRTNEAGATDGDYSGVPDEVVFTAGGALFRTFGVTAADDDVDDDGERVVLGFERPLLAGVTAGGTPEATVTLVDDDARGVTASQTAVSVDEDSSTSYTVVLASEPTAPVTVTVSGTSGTDLTAPAEGLVLTFTPQNWDVPQTVTVTAADDADVLADAAVELSHAVSGGDYGATAVPGPVVTVTIVENDTATVNVTDASASEAEAHVVFTVTLSAPSSATVTLDYATSDGTAAAPGDYTATSGTLTFASTVTEATISVPVIDDTDDEEEAETFTLTLSNVAQAGFAGGAANLAATGTIEDDDDPAVEVSFGLASYTAAEGGSPVTVTVSVDRDPERELTVLLTAEPGGGGSADDYSGVPEEVVFTAGGALSATFAVTAVDDDVDDDGETVELGFGTLPARVAEGGTATSTVTLTDEDERGVVVSETELTLAEGASGSYTVVLTSEPTATVIVTVGGSSNTHLTVSPSTVLVFTALTWDVPQTVTVTAESDADAVAPAAVELTHTVAGGDYAGEAAGSVTVVTTELTVPELTLSPSTASVSESVGVAGQAFTVTLSVASSETVTVSYGTADGTAAAGADYTSTSGTLTFSPGGSLSQTFSVPILGDALNEDDETFTVSLGSPLHATAGSSSVVTIADDDALPAVNLPSGFVIADEADGTLPVTVSLSAASGREVRVDYASADANRTNPATAGDDYGAVSGTLTFAAGETQQTFLVSIEDDGLDESIYEYFDLVLSNPVNATLGAQVEKSAQITDNDDQPTLNLSPSPMVLVTEGQAVTFTLELTAPSALAVPVRYRTEDLTAVAPGDYTATNGLTTVEIPAGETRRTFLVSTTDDALDEEEEEFLVRIVSAPNATLEDRQATVQITDNDDAPVLRVADVSVREDGGSLVFRARLDLPSAKEVTVDYTVSPGTAAPDDDYTAVPVGTLVFPAETTERTVVVPVRDDEEHEPDETVRLFLSGAVNATLPAFSATGTITNDEPLPLLTLGLNPNSIDESEGTSTVTASLSGLSSEPVTVTVATAAGAGTAAGDFTQSGTSLTIAAGSTASTGTVTVTAVDDDIDSPDKTVTVSGSATGGNGVAAPLSQALTIRDDEETPAVTLSLSPSSIGENGGTSTVTASLSGLSSTAVTVEVNADPGTGAEAGDFTQSGTTLAIGAKSLASTGTVTIEAVDNAFDTADKTVTVRGGVTGGSAQDPPPALLTIVDDEELMVSVTAAAPTVTEGSVATFPVTVTGGTSTSPVVITYQVVGTATSGVDYTSPAGMLTLDAGVGSGEISIQTLDEMVLDRGETLIVIVTGASASTGALTVVPQAAVTTIDDPGTVTVSVTAGAEEEVTEGLSATFMVELSGPVATPVTVEWSTSDGTATTAGLDYVPVPWVPVTFPAGATEAPTLLVLTNDDSLAEGEETFTVRLRNANLPDGVSVGVGEATARIVDNDDLAVSVSGPTTVAEGNTATFTVSVAGGTSTAPVVVTYTVGGTATSGTDYTAPGGTLTLEAGVAVGTVAIQTLDDMVLDRGETLVVTLTSATTSAGMARVGSPAAATTTIDDQGMETVSVTADAAVTEGLSAAFTVTLSGPVSTPVVVGWSTSDGTATAGSDYTAVSSGTVTFAAGLTASQALTVTTLGDSLAEGDETFTVTLSGSNLPDGVSLGTAAATGTITDDEALTVSVAGPSTVAEGSAATFTVTVAGGTSTAPVVVTYAVGGTATSGTDYTAPSGTLTLGAGVAVGTIAIQTLDDMVLDRGETLSVTLTGATTQAGTVSPETTAAVTTIVDGGTATVAVLSDGAVTEGSAAQFTVTLSDPVSTPVVVGWSTSDGSATAGSDYTAVSSGTVTFGAGSTASQTLAVTTLGDALAEEEETFTLTLTGSNLPDGVSVGTATATGTITDDEALTVAVAGPSTVVEGSSATFTVAVAGGTSTAPVVLTYTVGGTATSGTDYTAPSGTLTLGAGDAVGTIAIQTLDDMVLDRGETLVVTLTSATTSAGMVTVGSQPAATTTINDPGIETVSVTAGGAVTEGASATFTVALSGPVSSPVTLSWSTSDGTAAAGSDYTAVSSGTVTFGAGSTASQTLTVPTLGDSLAEEEETFTVTLTGSNLPDGVSLGTATATGRITDDEALAVTVAGPTTVVEGNTATFTVTVAGGTSTAPVVVTYTVGGTATSGSDYTAPSGTLTLVAGASSGTIAIATAADAVLDPGETVSVTLSGASTAAGTVTAGSTAAVATIADEGTETVSVTADGAVTEGTAATFTVTLSGPVSSPVTVGWSTSDGTATAGSDYTAVSSGTVTFGAGSTASQTLTVPTLGDSLAEGEETFAVTLTGVNLPAGVSLGTATATGRITDDEALAVTVAGPTTVVEGNTATFTVTVAGGTSTAPVVVTYTVGGTATSGSDYTAPSGTLTLVAGASSGTIAIATAADAVLDPGETVSVTLSGASTAAGTVTAGSTAAVATIADEGTETVSVTADGAVTEGTAATFTVTLSGPVSSPVTLSWSTSDGTAAAGSDYTAVSSGTVTFGAGSTASQTLTVPTLGDSLAEEEETFTVTLTGVNLPAGVSLGTATATGRITDNEALAVTVAGPTTVVEGNTATFTVTVAGGTSTAPVVVTYTVGGTATSGADYTAPSGTLTLVAGASSGTIAIATAADAVLDPGETVSVTLSGASTAAGTVTAGSTAAVVTIADEGTETVSVSADGAVTEGTAATFTVALSGAVSSAVTVGWSTSDGTATAGSDYAAVSSGTVTFAAHSTASQTLSVSTLGDSLAEGEETFAVTLTGVNLPAGVSLGTATATGRITDDEALTVSVAGPTTVVEGNTATFTVSVAGGTSTAPVVVTYTLGGTATPGADYTAPGGTLTLDAGASSGMIAIATTADAVLDPDETLSVTLSGASTAAGTVTAGSTAAVVTIADEGTETVSVTSDGAVTEGTSATFTVALSGAVSSAVTVGWSTSDGTAVAGSDYTAVSSGTVTFGAGSTASQTLTVPTLGDSLAEEEETFTVTLTGSNLPAGVSLGTATATGSITDDDPASTRVTLALNPDVVAEGAAATTVTVTATLNESARPDPTVVALSVAGTTADADDFAAVAPFELTIPAGSLTGTATFRLEPEDDEVAEGLETLSVGGTTEMPGLTVTAAELTLTDDDSAATEVLLSVNPSAVSEGAGGTVVTVTGRLNGSARTESTVVTVSVSGDTADADDFAVVSDFALTIAAEATEGTAMFTLEPEDDEVAEGSETLAVGGTTEVPGLTVTAAELTLTDDDSAATEVLLSVNPSAVSEGAGATVVTVTGTLNGSARSESTVVTVSVSGDTADADDFSAVTDFALTIAAEATEGTAMFTLEPEDDEVAEGSETLAVGGTTEVPGLTVTAAELTLTDDDSALTEVTLSLDPSTVSEGAGGTVVRVTGTLNGSVRSESTVVTVSVSGDTADADDFVAVSDFALTIAAEATDETAVFTLEPKDDEVAEDSETLSVGGTTEVPGLTVTAAELTLTDDDSASTEVTLSLNPAEVSEGAGTTEVTLTGRLNGAARSESTVVAVSVSRGTAGPDDFEPLSGFSLTILASATEGTTTFTLVPVDDELPEDAETLSVTGRITDVPGLAVTPAELTIVDDDGSSEGITLAVEPNAVMEDAGATEVTVKAALNDGVRQTKTIVAVVVDEDEDNYAVAPARFEMEVPAGETSVEGTFLLTPVDDEEDKEDRRVAITGTNGPDQLPVSATALTIMEDDEANKPPVAEDDSAETPEDTPKVIDVLANDSDPDGGRLRVSSVTAPSHGTATIASGGIRYAPALNWYGTDRFTYTIADPEGLTSTATVTMTVLPANDRPEAVDDEAETLEDIPAVVDVLANDTDVDGDPLQVVSVGPVQDDGDSGRRGAVCIRVELVRDGPLHLHDRRLGGADVDGDGDDDGAAGERPAGGGRGHPGPGARGRGRAGDGGPDGVLHRRGRGRADL